jgi:hypothetical protein
LSVIDGLDASLEARLDGLRNVLCLSGVGNEHSVVLLVDGVRISCFVGLRVHADFDFEVVLQDLSERTDQAHNCAILVGDGLQKGNERIVLHCLARVGSKGIICKTTIKLLRPEREPCE